MPECACGEDDCPNFDCGYPWCRSCAEHHRPPECAINQEGQSLADCGCPWDDVLDSGKHRPGCCYDDEVVTAVG